jgi:hypothetical protein
MRVHNTHDFIEKASIVHSNIYDYSLSVWVKSNLKLKIICKLHGIFEQRGNSHLKGRGCPHCGSLKCGRHKPLLVGKSTKVCPKCHNDYPRNDEYFGHNRRIIDGLNIYCKECLRIISLDRPIDPNYKRNDKKYNDKQREKGYFKVYYQHRRDTDVCFNIINNLRNRIWRCLKRDNARKHGTLWKLTGCNVDELKHWLESQFQEGMSWNNHGNDGWHIDHIIPCASFDLTDPEQQKKCFHYTNLQPLWAKDNLHKSCKIID